MGLELQAGAWSATSLTVRYRPQTPARWPPINVVSW